MQPSSSSIGSVMVMTVDQHDSRSGPDLVPSALATLATVAAVSGRRVSRAFERTVGDEIQGVLEDASTVAWVVESLLRQPDHWNIGIGVGPVERPLPASARSGRGPAYLHAREAVTAAKTSPWRLRVVGTDQVARDLESTLWLWAAVLGRRTRRGWEVADLVDGGASYEQAARALGITPSAVSQRAQAAGIVEGRRARELVTRLSERLLEGT